jgi:hypothetical protein
MIIRACVFVYTSCTINNNNNNLFKLCYSPFRLGCCYVSHISLRNEVVMLFIYQLINTSKVFKIALVSYFGCAREKVKGIL